MELAKFKSRVPTSPPCIWLLGVVLARTHVRGFPPAGSVLREGSERLFNTGVSQWVAFPWASGFNLAHLTGCKGTGLSRYFRPPGARGEGL